MRKIVFLDIDGVLNHHAFWDRYVEEHGKHVGMHHELCPISMGHLNRLLDETGAEVVVSSTWRLGRSLEELQEVLEANGFTGEVVGKTMNSYSNRRLWEKYHQLRGRQIMAYIREHLEEGDRFVILDDDSDMGPMLPWFVQTGFKEGLLPHHVEIAKCVLLEGKTLTDNRPEE